MIGLAQLHAELLRREGTPDTKPRRLLMKPDEKGDKTFAFKASESLRGGLARGMQRGGLSNSWTLLQHVGLKHRNRVRVAEDSELNLSLLGEALQVPREQILVRTYPEISSGVRTYFGLRISASNFETRHRRFSPAFFRSHGYHHASWELKFLPFCPETFELLDSKCTKCKPAGGRTQLWTRTQTPVDCCDDCGRRLADQPAKQVPKYMRPALEIIARVVSPDPCVRATLTEILPLQLKENNAQSILDVVLSLSNHVAVSSSPSQHPESLERLHLACKAVSQWPHGLEPLQFTASIHGAALPLIFNSYAALGVEHPSDCVRAMLNTGTIKAIASDPHDHQFALPDEIIGLTEACRTTGIQDDVLVRIWEERLLTRRYRSHGRRMVPAFHRKELMPFVNAWKQRLSAATLGYELGLPSYAIEQCGILGVLDPHPLTLKTGGMYFYPGCVPSFLEFLSKRSVPLNFQWVTLQNALRRTSGGLKPWGVLIKAMLDGEIRFNFKDHAKPQLGKCLLLAAEDVEQFMNQICDSVFHSIGGLTQHVPQKDALEILNCSGSSLGMLAGIEGQGINPKLFPLCQILERSRTAVPTIEIADHLGIEPFQAYDLLARARVVEIVPGGWDREHAYIVAQNAAVARAKQLSLFGLNSVVVQISGAGHLSGALVMPPAPHKNSPMRYKQSQSSGKSKSAEQLPLAL